MLFFLPLRVLNFPCYVELSLDPKLEFNFFQKTPKKQTNSRRFFKAYCVGCTNVKCNLFLSTNVLLFDVRTILIHHFVLLFSILSQKINK